MNFKTLILFVTIFFVTSLPTAYAKAWGHGNLELVHMPDCSGYILTPETQLFPAGFRPWLWFAPELGRGPHPNRLWIFDNLLQQGWMVVAVNIGESRGEPAGRAKFNDFYNYLMQRDLGLESKANLFAQSRGGLMHYNWAADHPNQVKSIGGIYMVGDLRSWPGLEKAAPVYNMTCEQLKKNLPNCNPIDRLAPLSKAKIPILHLHGDVDKSVPLEKNSAVVKQRYDKLGGNMRLIVVPGKGHEVVPEFFESADLFNFFYSNANIKMLKNASLVEKVIAHRDVEKGSTFDVQIIFKNAGTGTWTAKGGYSLSCIRPQDSSLADIKLSDDDIILPGQSKIVNIRVTAPENSITAEYRWQMDKSGSGIFGQIAAVKISVK